MKEHISKFTILSAAILATASSAALGDHHLNDSQLSKVEGDGSKKRLRPRTLQIRILQNHCRGRTQGSGHQGCILQDARYVSYDGKILVEKPITPPKVTISRGPWLSMLSARAITSTKKVFQGLKLWTSEKWNKIGDSEDSIEGQDGELDNGHLMVKVIVDNWQWVAVSPATTEVTATLGGAYSLEDGIYWNNTFPIQR